MTYFNERRMSTARSTARRVSGNQEQLRQENAREQANQFRKNVDAEVETLMKGAQARIEERAAHGHKYVQIYGRRYGDSFQGAVYDKLKAELTKNLPKGFKVSEHDNAMGSDCPATHGFLGVAWK